MKVRSGCVDSHPERLSSKNTQSGCRSAAASGSRGGPRPFRAASAHSAANAVPVALGGGSVIGGFLRSRCRRR